MAQRSDKKAKRPAGKKKQAQPNANLAQFIRGIEQILVTRRTEILLTTAKNGPQHRPFSK